MDIHIDLRQSLTETTTTRLRSWWRHGQQSVATALSAAAHHSFDKVAAGEKYDGLRAQKTDTAGMLRTKL